MLKALTTLADCQQFYFRKTRGKISSFLSFHTLPLTMSGYIQSQWVVDKPEGRSRRKTRKKTFNRYFDDCLLYVPKRCMLFQNKFPVKVD